MRKTKAPRPIDRDDPRHGPGMAELLSLLRFCGHDLEKLDPPQRQRAQTLAGCLGIELPQPRP